jgi:Fur family transcriptional regulator, ferric uptake regulator
MKSNKLLKQLGLKNTKQRQALLEVLMSQVHPINAETCYILLNQQQHSINLSTIYRTLEQFTQLGLIEKSYSSLTAGYVYTFKSGHHRHYMLCVKCQQMFPLDVCPMHDIIESIEHTYGFKVNAHQLELSGICRSCQS